MFKMLGKTGFWLVMLSLVSAGIFWKAIAYPFFQDDFFVLGNTAIYSPHDLINLFRPQAGAVYWRPLGIQLYFGLMQLLPLSSALTFHLFGFGIHLLNIYLVLLLTEKMFQNSAVSRLTAFFYAVSPIHYFSLGWAVNFSYILVITFSSLALISALSNKFILSVIYTILAVATNELAITLPVLLLMALLWGRRAVFLKNRLNLLTLIVSALLVAGYLVWRYTMGFLLERDYALAWQAPIKALRWYGLWMMGFSDITRDHLRSLISFRILFIDSFPWLVLTYLIQWGLVALIGVGLFRQAIIKRQRRLDLVISSLWVIVALLPVLFFPTHLYSHYATFASIAVYWAICRFLVQVKSFSRMLLPALALWWLVVSTMTMRLNYLASWMADHARESTAIQAKINNSLNQIPSPRKVYIVTQSTKPQLILAREYGAAYLAGVNRDQVRFVNTPDEVYTLEFEAETINEESQNSNLLLRQRGIMIVPL